MSNKLNKKAGFGKSFKLFLASDRINDDEITEFHLLGTEWAVGLAKNHHPSARGTLSKAMMDEALEIIKHDTDSSED
jgi:hypothetical protein